MPNNQEHRKYARRQIEVTTTVSVDGHQVVLKTKDLSDGGAFLQKGNSPIPAMDTEMFVEISSAEDGAEPMVTRAKVVHVAADGFGIIFLE